MWAHVLFDITNKKGLDNRAFLIKWMLFVGFALKCTLVGLSTLKIIFFKC